MLHFHVFADQTLYRRAPERYTFYGSNGLLSALLVNIAEQNRLVNPGGNLPTVPSSSKTAKFPPWYLRRHTQAVITITLQAAPASRQDFRFQGDLGDFRLDGAAPDDGDAINQRITFTVTPGVYQVTEMVPATWHLSQISCTPAAQAVVQLMTGQATLTVAEGDQLDCTFGNQRGVVIQTRSYHDFDGSRTYSLGERYLNDQTMTLYRDQNIVMGTQLTNLYGKANFNYLPAGDYAICEIGHQPWVNSQPGRVEPAYGAACYTVTLQPSEQTTVWFGNQRVGDPPPEPLSTVPRTIAVVQGADVEQDDSGYDQWVFIDADMQNDERPPLVFLPLAFVH